MSGKAAISGYMCQTMIAIISFLDDESWDTMTMEPQGKNAVDIILKKENTAIKCIQVKAWNTTYSRSALESAFTGLCKLLPDASHELILVGENYAETAEKYISEVNSNKITNDTDTANLIKTVRLKPNELEKQLIGCAVNYVKQKKYLYNNAGRHTFSPEEIEDLFNGEPVYLGWEAMDGNIPACNEYSGYFTIRLKASVREVSAS